MKKTLISLLALSFLLIGCDLVTDKGRSSSSDIKGYERYTNRTLGISVLAPSNWENKMTIGGNYNMNPKPVNTYDSITISSSKLEGLFEGKLSGDASLDEFKHMAETHWYNAASIGPEMKSSWTRTTLAGKPAWEVTYAYSPKKGLRRFTKHVMTTYKKKSYMLNWYGKASEREKYAEEFKIIRDSFKIID